MAGIQITITGNLGQDPKLRYTRSGVAMTTFTVACRERVRDGSGEWRDGPTSWMRCTAWSDLAVHISNSVSRGDRVMVSGQLRHRAYVDNDGVRESVWEVTVGDAGPSLRYATATVAKAARAGAPPDDRV